MIILYLLRLLTTIFFGKNVMTYATGTR